MAPQSLFRFFLCFSITAVLLSLPATACDKPQKSPPIAMTLYTPVSNEWTWWAGQTSGKCREMLEQGRPYFQAVTIQVDFEEWHRGNPTNPIQAVDAAHETYLWVKPARPTYLDNLADCMITAHELGFSPIVLKIKIMDYIGSGKAAGPHYWRAWIPFDPFNGNYISGEFGPVDLGIRAIQKYAQQTGCRSCNEIIFSYNDEYVYSAIRHPEAWGRANDTVGQRLNELGLQARLAVNLDWSTLVHLTFRSKKPLAPALRGLSVVGWSLYKPFLGFTKGLIKWEQKEYAKQLRRFINDVGRPDLPIAIFEYGVNNKFHPSDWNQANLAVDQQRLAYRGWIEMLASGETPVTAAFTFWWGIWDPRTTAEKELVEYAKNWPNR